jgi:gliding motility-associated peptidyl-prolyl isomerase
MRIIAFILIGFTIISCQDQIARKPSEKKSHQTNSNSVERKKLLLENEMAEIEHFVEIDSTHQYFKTDTGIRYYYVNKIEEFERETRVDDPIQFGYELFSLKKEAIYPNLHLNDTIHSTLSDTSFFPGFRLALWLLKENEEAHFLIPSPLAYGYRGDGDKIGPNFPLFIKIKRYAINTNKQQ